MMNVELSQAAFHSSFITHHSSFPLCRLLVGEGDDLVGGVLHALADGEVHAVLGDEAATLFDFCAFLTYDVRFLDSVCFRRLNVAARDLVCADDAAEDVD